MMKQKTILALGLALALLMLGGAEIWAQAANRPIVKVSENRPLASLREAAEASRATIPPFRPGVREIPNFRGAPEGPAGAGADPVLQQQPLPNASTNILTGFEGADNEDNLTTVGFRVAPPDTNGDVGPNHYMQMINLITTIFDKTGNVVSGPFASNAFWTGVGGNCEPFNQGDPVTLYDETNDRWLVSQFAFDDNFTTFSQCVAISQTGDPTGAYNRYEFSFDGLGLPDYPKHGIVTDSVTLMANLFSPPLFFFSGTFIAAIDKDAMYAGQTTTLVGFNLGGGQFGFLPADLDDPSGTASFTSALFGTAFSRNRRFDIWEIDVDWNNPGAATASRIDDVRISNFDADLCGASREACIPQPNGGPALEAISDRLMHRLQIRDFGSHKSLVTAHTVDVGGGRAGIRWYEIRQNPNNGNFSLHQEGTYGPNDGLNRWMPSVAMNAAGDIGFGYLVSSTSEPMGSRVNGQTAGASGSDLLDGTEQICRSGVTEQTGTARSGDYGATTVDPVNDTFWHTNEYGQRNDKSAGWGTFVCEFMLAGGGCTPTENPEMSCNDGLDNDCDGLIDGDDPDCGGGACSDVGEACQNDADCCSGNCSNGPPASRMCQP